MGAHAARIRRRLAPWSGPFGFANLDTRVVDAAEVLPAPAARLAADVKAHYDPANVIDAIHPAGA